MKKNSSQASLYYIFNISIRFLKPFGPIVQRSTSQAVKKGANKSHTSLNLGNMNFVLPKSKIFKIRAPPKFVYLKKKVSKNVLLKFFWTQFKIVHCRGPCSLRPCISRPYCIQKFDFETMHLKNNNVFPFNQPVAYL